MDEAEALFRDAVQRAPQLRHARYGLAKLLKFVGQYQQAVELFEAEIQREPKNINLRLLRRNALLQMQRSDQAIEGLLAVLKLDECNFPERHSLASQFTKRGENARVIKVLTSLLDEFADDASINYLLASAYSEKGDTKRADRQMQQYLNGRMQLDELAMIA